MKRTSDPELKALQIEYWKGIKKTVKKRWPILLALCIAAGVVVNLNLEANLLFVLLIVIMGTFPYIMLYDNRQTIKAMQTYRKQQRPVKWRQMRIVSTVVIVLVSVACVIGVSNWQHQNQLKSPGYRTSVKNAFMSGCTRQVPSSYSPDKKEQYCSCAFGVLEQRHSDKIYTSEFNDEIIKNGIERADTDAIVNSCVMQNQAT